MKIPAIIRLAIVALASVYPSSAQQTVFTYQGRLSQGANPANGSYDLRFTLYDAASLGGMIGTPLTNAAIVTNGLFTASLDFGSVFDGSVRWLEIAVRTNGSVGPFTLLAPRQPISAVPYAITARNVTGSVTAGQLTGSIPAANIGAGTITAVKLDSSIGLWSKAGTNLHYDGGNIGIGTINPGVPLEVSGQLSVFSPINTLRKLSLDYSGIAARLDLNNPSDYIALGVTNHESVRIRHDGVEIMGIVKVLNGPLTVPPNGLVADGSQLVLAGGNVGIGTASPGQLLSLERATGDVAIMMRQSSAGLSYTVGIDEADSGKLKVASGGNFTKPRITVDSAGNVGIGTNAPQAKLDVNGTVKATNFVGSGLGLTGLAPASGSSNYVSTAGDTMTGSLILPTNGLVAGSNQLVLSDGNVRIWGISEATLDVRHAPGNTNSVLDILKGLGDSDSPVIRVYGDHPKSSLTMVFTVLRNGKVGIGTNQPQEKLHVLGNAIISGTNTVKVLSITAGADVAEPFTMSGNEVPAGAVVVIDDQHPGQLKRSERAYDKRVAGIVSGAGGVNPGLTLSQPELVVGGQNVALTGRVYALADAANGPIQPGDLLTTSSVPGHAMKVSDSGKAQGAILGKAMSRLESGRGLVLVLVTLQ